MLKERLHISELCGAFAGLESKQSHCDAKCSSLGFGLLVIWNLWKTLKGYWNLGVTCGLRYPLASFGASQAKALSLFVGLCSISSLVHKLLKVRDGPNRTRWTLSPGGWDLRGPRRELGRPCSWQIWDCWQQLLRLNIQSKSQSQLFKRLIGIYWKRLGHTILLLFGKVAETLIPPVATKEPSSSQCSSRL